MTKPTASIVLGGGHSIGVPLAVSASRSFIVPSATMTIGFILSHSKVKEEYFRHLINRTDVLVNDIGSILNGYEAVECGLVDEIGGIKEALAYLKERAKKK